MPPKFLRPLLVVEFLIAIQAVFTFWSQVGGQYHLDLMYWPWKFGVGIVAALLITWITAALVRTDGAVTGRIYVLGTLLLVTIAIAGCVTYYYHINEPADEEDQGDAQPTISRMNQMADPAKIESMEKVIRIFHSFEEADAADVRERSQMTPQQRVDIFFELQKRMEPDGPEQGFARVYRVLELERS